MKTNFNISCPIPLTKYPKVILSHGGGGKLMHDLIEKMFVSVFDNPYLNQRHDATLVDVDERKIAMTTDSYVIYPLFFPGGDIGSLAVHGTVNDLAMTGAVPKYITLGLIIEEGLDMEVLWRIVQSVKKAADEAGVVVVTGDTKVVERGKGDGIYINTAGVGVIEHGLNIHPRSIQKGDVILVNGDIGRHGMAIMAQRENLSFESDICSDSASVSGAVQALLSQGIHVRCLRDLTRGGLATTLNEIAQSAGVRLSIDEASLPVDERVQAACELLGFDPLYVACEGRFVVFVPPEQEGLTRDILAKQPGACEVSSIGCVQEIDHPLVSLKTNMGVERIIDMLSTEQLPRIC